MLDSLGDWLAAPTPRWVFVLVVLAVWLWTRKAVARIAGVISSLIEIVRKIEQQQIERDGMEKIERVLLGRNNNEDSN